MNQLFKKQNNIVGWVIFAIATVVYLLTMERHISFWDTGEYIVSSAKLGVTHAPGAALFQLIGAVWSGLAFGDGNLYPILINSLSAICSGFTILFLFWTITHFAKKIIFSQNSATLNAEETQTDLTQTQRFIILASGVVGALAFTFSDTFWYSAVEGEVYAMSSCFTALIVWLACKWDNEADKPRSDRWLILIALVIGLGTGVHLMTILAVPVVGYIYYVRKYKITIKSFIIANIIIAAILGFVFKIIFPATMAFFGRTEMYMVNEIGLPFNSGSLIAGLVLAALIAGLLYYSKKWNSKILNSVVLSIAFMLIGFSCWLVIPIRANANPHMNLNNPDTALGTLDYFNRVQYGDWPTFYGPVYTAHIEDVDDVFEKTKDGAIKSVKDGAEYKKDEKRGRYIHLMDRTKPVYKKKHVKFFPKMYNESPEVMENYANWYGFPEFELAPQYRNNEQANRLYSDLLMKKERGELRIRDLEQYAEVLTIEPPTLAQQMAYFFDFQVGYMFIRYFMWNFAGRQNDWEGHREVSRGNWISGIPFIDNMRLGDQSKLPDQFKKNASRNVYFMLPLILGLIGFLFHLNKNFGIWWSMVVLFLLTSVGIIFYTSVKPFEPRERDYALVTAFFAFSVWIGLGVLAIFNFLQKSVIKNAKPSTALIVGGICLCIPLLMGFQNWDDHNRSNRKAASDFAYNYLNGLDENAILFVYGDNDTYPLWGYQETTGFRSDVKVNNFTLMGAPWYLEQVFRKTYDAAPLPHSMKYSDYQISTNDVVQVLDKEFFIENTLIDSSEIDFNQIDMNSFNKLKSLSKYITIDSMTAKEAMNFLLKKNPDKDILLELFEANDKAYNFLPVNKIVIPVNKENALKHGIVAPEDADKIVDNIEITIAASGFGKAELAMLDLFANYNWDRPIYFSGGGLYKDSNIFYLGDYLQYNGMTYKLVPIKTPFGEDGSVGRINSNVMQKVFDGMKWANFKDPNSWFDETGRNYTQSYRNIAYRLAKQLNKEGKKKEAEQVLDKIMEEIPISKYYWDSVLARLASLYAEIGNQKKADEILNTYKEKTQQIVTYFESLDDKYKYSIIGDYEEAVSDLGLSVYTELKGYLEKGDTIKAKTKFKEYFEPAKKELLELSDLMDENQDDVRIQNKFESKFNGIQELLGIANLIDSVYAEEEHKKLFEALIPEEVQDSVMAIPEDTVVTE